MSLSSPTWAPRSTHAQELMISAQPRAAGGCWAPVVLHAGGDVMDCSLLAAEGVLHRDVSTWPLPR